MLLQVFDVDFPCIRLLMLQQNECLLVGINVYGGNNGPRAYLAAKLSTLMCCEV